MQTLCTDHFREGEIAALFNAEAAEGGICYACHRRKQHGYAAARIAAKYFESTAEAGGGVGICILQRVQKR